jgi:hypothetical protein
VKRFRSAAKSSLEMSQNGEIISATAIRSRSNAQKISNMSTHYQEGRVHVGGPAVALLC